MFVTGELSFLGWTSMDVTDGVPISGVRNRIFKKCVNRHDDYGASRFTDMLSARPVLSPVTIRQELPRDRLRAGLFQISCRSWREAETLS